MASPAKAGAVAGLVAGVVCATIMTFMEVPAPGGVTLTLMELLSRILGTDGIAAGWVVHLLDSALMGAIFGWAMGPKVADYRSGLAMGALYGGIWWVLGVMVIGPLLVGLPAFAPLADPALRLLAYGSLVAALAFGVILGTVYYGLLAGEIRLQPAYPQEHLPPPSALRPV
ncbi:MAG TPA: hypothetical protein VEI97_18185 [bacterium]|nr:hypothetical protein [bacterium]